MARSFPALALLEYPSIARGIAAVDRMIKRAPVAMLKCGTVHPGRYLVLLGGTVASTEEAYQEGVGAGGISAAVLLPEADPQLSAAVLGHRQAPVAEALGVFETTDSPALLRAIDAAVKATPVRIVEIRLADDLGGHALALLDGLLPDVAAALEIAHERVGSPAAVVASTLMPRLDEDLRTLLEGGTAFAPCRPCQPAGAELPEDDDGFG